MAKLQKRNNTVHILALLIILPVSHYLKLDGFSILSFLIVLL